MEVHLFPVDSSARQGMSERAGHGVTRSSAGRPQQRAANMKMGSLFRFGIGNAKLSAENPMLSLGNTTGKLRCSLGNTEFRVEYCQCAVEYRNKLSRGSTNGIGNAERSSNSKLRAESLDLSFGNTKFKNGNTKLSTGNVTLSLSNTKFENWQLK